MSKHIICWNLCCPTWKECIWPNTDIHTFFLFFNLVLSKFESTTERSLSIMWMTSFTVKSGQEYQLKSMSWDDVYDWLHQKHISPVYLAYTCENCKRNQNMGRAQLDLKKTKTMKSPCWIYLRLAGRILPNRRHVYHIQPLWSAPQSMITDIVNGPNKIFREFEESLKR